LPRSFNDSAEAEASRIDAFVAAQLKALRQSGQALAARAAGLGSSSSQVSRLEGTQPPLSGEIQGLEPFSEPALEKK